MRENAERLIRIDQFPNSVRRRKKKKKLRARTTKLFAYNPLSPFFNARNKLQQMGKKERKERKEKNEKRKRKKENVM